MNFGAQVMLSGVWTSFLFAAHWSLVRERFEHPPPKDVNPKEKEIRVFNFEMFPCARHWAGLLQK